METMMVFPDDIASVDLLHAEPIAETIVEVIRAHPGHSPVIGIHGDWGAGKSTVLKLVSTSLARDSKTSCLWFNGWEYEGFEDAKIAILVEVVRHLASNRRLTAKAKRLLSKLRKQIDVMKLTKIVATGAAGFIAAGPAGLAMIIPSLLDTAKLSQRVEKVGEAVKEKQSDAANEDPVDLQAFRANFKSLLAETGISQLVVLVDDLDRCLPKTAIGTLEAIRLFLSNGQISFVLACDRTMIEYAVREHFPERVGHRGQTYARNYLDKLIQIPFALPLLGPLEVDVYAQLLVLEQHLGSDNDAFLAVLQDARAISRTPWLTQTLNLSPVRGELDKNKEFSALHSLMSRISAILSSGTDGNPRQIKRFINTIFIRMRVAYARGLGEKFEIAILTKLMLVEYFQPELFDQLANESRVGRGNKTLEYLEDYSRSAAKASGESDGDAVPGRAHRAEETDSDFLHEPRALMWAALEPPMATEDLRPYLFVMKDARTVVGSIVPQEVEDLIAHIRGGLSLLAKKAAVQTLSLELRGALAAELVARLSKAIDPKRQNTMAVGIKDLLNLDASLLGVIDRSIVQIPTTLVDTWISSLAELARSGEGFRRWLASARESASKPVITLIDTLLK